MNWQLLRGLAVLAAAAVLTPRPRCQAQPTVSGIRFAIEPTFGQSRPLYRVLSGPDRRRG